MREGKISVVDGHREAGAASLHLPAVLRSACLAEPWKAPSTRTAHFQLREEVRTTVSRK